MQTKMDVGTNKFALSWRYLGGTHIMKINIGIKHGFLCINICWAPREMLKPEPERRGFQPLPRGPADVNVSGNHV